MTDAIISVGFSLLTSGRGNVLADESTHQAISAGRTAIANAYRPAIRRAAQNQLNKFYKNIAKKAVGEALEWAAEYAMEEGTKLYVNKWISLYS